MPPRAPEATGVPPATAAPAQPPPWPPAPPAGKTSEPPSRALTLATLPVTLLVQAASSAALLTPAVAAPRLLPPLGLGSVAIGLYIAVVYLAAMASSLFGAALVRRWGPIRSSQAALGVSALGLLLVAVPHTGVALAGALLIGLGYGPITPASSEMLARTTPPQRISLVFSIKQTGVPVGGALAGLLVPAALVAGGVPAALGLMALLCGAGVLLAIPLRQALDRQRDPAAPWPSAARMAEPLRFVAGHPVLRPLAMCTLVFSMVQVSLTSFLVSFLNLDLGWSLVAAGVALSLSQATGAGGRILWGLLADCGPDGPRRTLLGLAVAMALTGATLALVGRDTPTAVVLGLVALFGASAVGWNGVYLGTVARLVPHDRTAMATGGTLFFTFFGVVIGPPLFGLAGSAFGSHGPAFALLALPLAFAAGTLARAHWPMPR